MKRYLLVVLVVAIALGTVGCGAIVEKAVKKGIENKTGVKVDDKTGEVTVKGKDGSEGTFGASEGKLPEGFPSDFPQPDGATIQFGSRLGKGDKWAYQVTYETDQTLKEAAAFYKDELPNAGWTIKNTIDTGGMVIYELEKGTDQAGNVSVTRDEDKGKTIIMVTLTPKES